MDANKLRQRRRGAFTLLLEQKTLLYLTFALLDQMSPFGVKATCELLKAAEQLRKLTGVKPQTPSKETEEWNTAHCIGDAVIVALDDRDPFIGFIATPAFDTPDGPHAMIDDHEHAVAIRQLSPFQGSERGLA